MRVTFYGTRGSIATPGPSTVRYGGNTSCVAVRSDAGTLVILDIGTGAAVLGRELMAKGGKLKGHIMIGHTHWDHIQGLPFFAPLFVPGNEWDIYAPRGLRESLQDTLAGQMEYTYFPVELDQLGATIRYHDLIEGSLNVGDIAVTARYLNHPALTLGYRLHADGATMVYSCDHEPHSRTLAVGPGLIEGQDAEHAAFLADADLAIHDAQYVAGEYAAKVGWGHSTVEYAVNISRHAGVKRLALTHHDPTRNDAAVDAVLKGLKTNGLAGDMDVFAAAEGMEVELVGEAERPVVHDEGSAHINVSSSLAQGKVLMAMADPVRIEKMRKIMAEDHLRETVVAPHEAAEAAQRESPSLLVLEHDGDHEKAAAVARAIRAEMPDLPIMLVTNHGEEGPGHGGLFTDRLAEPFSAQYARARMRAALMRRASKWVRALRPADEEKRIATLYRLGILDTEKEERFDRITRLAAAMFNVPVALITLIDRERQWIKSSAGVDVTETARDEAFCSHVVADRKPLLVQDARNDPRFAENPLVTDGPKVRFYAGYPLFMDDGSCVGTICLVDNKPRDFGGRGLALLSDMAQLAKKELEKPAGGEETVESNAGGGVDSGG
jgi:phosphoribosyl 1,2-cyclic phosphodiesterase/DNA-binding response OmpR family regulator